MKQPKQKQPNMIITATAQDKASGFYIGNRKLLFDNRLTHQERNILNIFLVLKDFKLTTKATAEFLNITEPTLVKVLKNLKSLGYLEVERNGKSYTYHFRDESKYMINDFNIKDIQKIPLEHLIALHENKETPSNIKNLLKKYIDALTNYQNVLTEIKEIELPKDIYKEQLENEQEQKNLNDFFANLGVNFDDE